MRGAYFFCVGDSVGQDQAAFSVGVDDFDRLAGHRHLDVARFLSASAGHIFGGWNYGDYFDGGLQARDGANRAEHGGAAAHIVFHFFHTVGGLDGNSASIKSDRFADEREDRRAFFNIRGRVSQDDYAGRLDAALRYPDQRAHFQFGDALLIENIHRQAEFFSHGFGALG